jgi:hypothetical protein
VANSLATSQTHEPLSPVIGDSWTAIHCLQNGVTCKATVSSPVVHMLSLHCLGLSGSGHFASPWSEIQKEREGKDNLTALLLKMADWDFAGLLPV